MGAEGHADLHQIRQRSTDLARRIAATMYLIDLAIARTIELRCQIRLPEDGYPVPGEPAACDRCGVLRATLREGDDVLCDRCDWIVRHPGICCECSEPTDHPSDELCNACKLREDY